MIKTKYILLLFVGLFMFSCNSKTEKDNENTITDKDTTVVLNAYNLETERKVQTFEINTSVKQEIKGEEGTVVTFPKGCFGKVHGKIKIELIECYSIQDMIFNRLSTQTTDGKLLESDGMIYLNALNEKGYTLEIKQGKVGVKMPTKQMKNRIQIFEGVENSNDITWNLSNEKLMVEDNKIKKKSNVSEENEHEGSVSNNSFNHLHSDSTFQTQPKTGQSQIIIDKQIKNEFLANYVFNITKMGWINCDRFIEGENKDLFVSVGEGQENVSFYLVLDKINSNVMPRNPKAVNGKFEFRNIPVKESFTLVALATKGDKIYFGMANHGTNNGTVNCPELKPLTRQELTDLLMKKFGKDIWNRPLA